MPTRLTRRSFIAGTATILMVAPVFAKPLTMTAKDVHVAAGKGELLLLDIRSRGEWQQTGIGSTALPVSMHEAGFLQKLEKLTGGDKSKPVALICAVGGRSNSLQGILSRLGYSQIIDVSEGMIGGVKGTGWIKLGLPVKAFQP